MIAVLMVAAVLGAIDGIVVGALNNEPQGEGPLALIIIVVAGIALGSILSTITKAPEGLGAALVGMVVTALFAGVIQHESLPFQRNKKPSVDAATDTTSKRKRRGG